MDTLIINAGYCECVGCCVIDAQITPRRVAIQPCEPCARRANERSGRTRETRQ